MSSRSSGSRFRDKIATLNRRADFLEERIKNYVGADPSRDRAEFAAIKWSIAIIEAYPEEALLVLKTRDF